MKETIKAYFWSSLAIVLVFSMMACGEKISMRDSNLGSGDADRDKSFVSSVPPTEYYDYVLKKKMLSLEEQSIFNLTSNNARAEVPIIWLNFEGGLVKRGYDVGTSFLICTSETLIPTSVISFEKQQEILENVQGYFDKAEIPVKVVLEEPTSSGLVTVIYISNSIEDLECKAKGNAVVLAPQDKGNVNLSDIAFVFTKAINEINSDPEKLHLYLSHAIAHAIGLTMGLSPDNQVRTVMYPVPSDEVEGFSEISINTLKEIAKKHLVQAATVGNVQGLNNLPLEYIRLPGLEKLVVIGGQIPKLKKENVIDITAILQMLEALLPEGVTIPEFDKIVTVVELAMTLAAQQQQNAGNDIANLTPEELMKIAATVLTTEHLGQAVEITALVIAGGGVGSIGAAIKAIQLAINIAQDIQQNNQTADDALTDLIARIPNLALLLGIDQISDIETLIEMLEAHAAVVNANFQGPVKDGLLSMLKVAYAQRYHAIIAE